MNTCPHCGESECVCDLRADDPLPDYDASLAILTAPIFPDAQALAARLATNCDDVDGDCLNCDLFDDCEALSPDRED